MKVYSDKEIKLLKLAGKIAKSILNNVTKKIEKKEIVSDIEVVKFVDEKIKEIKEKKEINIKKAFPVNISVNEIAAHYTPYNNSYIFKEEDIIKIDLGIQIDGYIADNAKTVYIGNDKVKKDLVISSKKALDRVKKIIKSKIKISEIGKGIEEEIKSLGFNPIYNLGGHSIERYNLHSGIFIPNYDNKSGDLIKPGLFAVEPFSTTGEGFVKDFKFSNIVVLKKIRTRIPISLRKYYDLLKNEFNYLPFSLLDMEKTLNLDEKKILYLLNQMEKFQLIYKYPILIEKSKGLVSQHEDTFLVTEDKVIITTEEE